MCSSARCVRTIVWLPLRQETRPVSGQVICSGVLVPGSSTRPRFGSSTPS